MVSPENTYIQLMLYGLSRLYSYIWKYTLTYAYIYATTIKENEVRNLRNNKVSFRERMEGGKGREEMR